MNFTWEALGGASTALKKLYEIAGKLPEPEGYANKYEVEFLHVLGQDLNMPRAIAVMWEMLRSDQLEEAKAAALRRMDEVLGLRIFETSEKMTTIPEDVMILSNEREKLRKEGRFMLADQIRHKIEKMGFEVDDQKKGPPKILRKI